MNEIYQCICHTCDEDGVQESLEQAQTFFNEHADRGCEVVIENVQSSRETISSVASEEGTASADSPSTVD